MASIFKPKGKTKYVILYYDETGRRRKKTGAADKQTTERIARSLESRVALLKEGVIDAGTEARRDHEAKPLRDHIDAWEADMRAKGRSPDYIAIASNRVRRLVTIVLGAAPDAHDTRGMLNAHRVESRARLSKAIARARLSHLTGEAVQSALGRLRAAGWSAQTCNHYRTSARAFAHWCRLTGRLNSDPLIGVSGYNVKEDRRHDRRTLSVDEMRRLIQAAHDGPVVAKLDGATRALCYRLAAATGLRYEELSSLTPESFNLGESPTVTVLAGYCKDGETATQPLPPDLIDDLGDHLARFGAGEAVFKLPYQRGARMLRRDLKAAGIPYRDAAGLVFDFHALRCQFATLADAAGVTPRVVQKLMRHSTLELTARYTRPRVVDLEAAASRIPSLKPTATRNATQADTA